MLIFGSSKPCLLFKLFSHCFIMIRCPAVCLHARGSHWSCGPGGLAGGVVMALLGALPFTLCFLIFLDLELHLLFSAVPKNSSLRTRK